MYNSRRSSSSFLQQHANVQFTIQHPAHVHSMYKKLHFSISEQRRHTTCIFGNARCMFFWDVVSKTYYLVFKTHTSYCKLDVSSVDLGKRLEFVWWSSHDLKSHVGSEEGEREADERAGRGREGEEEENEGERGNGRRREEGSWMRYCKAYVSRGACTR